MAMKDPMIQAMFGCHAVHGATQLILQKGTRTPDGRYITAVVGVLVTAEDPFSPEAQAHGFPHELLVGDLVVRPHGKFSGKNGRGQGLAGLVCGAQMFPDGWDYQTLDNGFSHLHPEAMTPPRLRGTAATEQDASDREEREGKC